METIQLADTRPTVFEGMIGACAAMKRVFDNIERAAEADTTVLIRGESGTGKELVAAAIHRSSSRREEPFVALNVAAVPASLIESELFGHVEGAFTGANKSRIGRFEAAHKGTLFIDEIGDLELAFQTKLLRVMEDHLITPVGSNETKEVDVRLIFATNRNLERMISEEKFRQDLYYRINVLMISLPPLRERGEDIPLLIDYFLDEICAEKGKPRATPDPSLMEFLQNYEWPGNVRQLRSCLESMVIFAGSERLTMEDLPAVVRCPAESNGNGCCPMCRQRTLEEVVREIIFQRLRDCGGNRTKAAQSLGISARTLQRRLKIWDQNPSEGDGDLADALLLHGNGS